MSKRFHLTKKRCSYLSPLQLENARRIMKNRKEKERRDNLNEWIRMIGNLLGLADCDRTEILRQAYRRLEREILGDSAVLEDAHDINIPKLID